MLDVVSFDLDSTLCSTHHRRHIIDKQHRDRTDWVAYSMACKDDGKGPAFDMAMMLHEMNVPMIVTSRRDQAAYDLTMEWLDRHGLTDILEVNLLKGPNSNNEFKQAPWKVKSIRDYEQRSGNRVVLHVDDFPDVIAAVRADGIGGLLVTDGYESEQAPRNSYVIGNAMPSPVVTVGNTSSPTAKS